mmetsp:Transcript_71157/g.200060  ORF Transcript_71157/g.200060 Transcript_71157/m.200060 type:complete len:383 (+) Transcript_71157:189-1337(+)
MVARRRRRQQLRTMRKGAVHLGLLAVSFWRAMPLLNAATLPTTLPTATTDLDYSSGGWSGTIPTELGLLVDVTYFDLGSNALTGTVPTVRPNSSPPVTVPLPPWSPRTLHPHPTTTTTSRAHTRAHRTRRQTHHHTPCFATPQELGYLSEITGSGENKFLGGNGMGLTGTMPTELGNFVKMTEWFYADGGNAMSGTFPTQLGRLVEHVKGFNVNGNAFTGAMPTQLGNMVKMSSIFNLGDNHFSSSIPTEFGKLDKMVNVYRLWSNKLCNDVPTEVQALSSGVGSYFQVTTDNSIGTTCGWIEDARFPGVGPTSVTSISWGSSEKSGTLPTEIGALTQVTGFGIGGNEMTGQIPTQLGRLTEATYVALQTCLVCLLRVRITE